RIGPTQRVGICVVGAWGSFTPVSTCPLTARPASRPWSSLPCSASPRSSLPCSAEPAAVRLVPPVPSRQVLSAPAQCRPVDGTHLAELPETAAHHQIRPAQLLRRGRTQ